MDSCYSKTMIDKCFLLILNKIFYPGFNLDIVSIGLVEEAKIIGAKAIIKLRPLLAPPYVFKQLEKNIVTELANNMPEIKELDLVQPKGAQTRKKMVPSNIEGVNTVIPIISGKGGVGKSTVAINLALALAELGFKVGLLDLDLYGPSIPFMLGLSAIQLKNNTETITPIIAYGLKVMSIGFMVEANKALIWRGPIIMKAVKQLIHKVAWAPLDILILDLPPGTGDIQITMIQEVIITGGIIVTSPQEVALVDAIKVIDMFKTADVTILGIIENMSYFICDSCNKRHNIFGYGSVKSLAKRFNISYLGELILDIHVRVSMDSGRPIVSVNSPSALPYRKLATKILEKIN